MAYDDDYIPDIEFTPAGDSADEQKAVLKTVRPSPGFPACAQLLAEAIEKQSLTTVLDFTPQQVTIRFQIDGLWHAGAPMDRETGDFMLATLKRIAGLDYRQRRARQEGQFQTMYLKTKQKVRVVCQGIKTGERVAIYLDWKRPPMETAEQLGMRKSMIDRLSGILENADTGLVLVGAVPGEGYTSLWRGVLGICDRLTRDYFVIEEKNESEEEVINVYPVAFDRSRGESSLSPIPQLLLKQPDVLAFNEIADADTLDDLVSLSVEKKMPVYLRYPGKGAIDTVLRLLAIKPQAKPFVERLDAVIAMRMVRCLCENCRVKFSPHPNLLKKIGLPPGRVAELFKPFVYQPGMLDENEKEIVPCPECHGIGYKGRTGVFELLVLNDKIRAALLSSPTLNGVMNVALQNGHVSMQQEGIVLVARGLTSLEELQRVLKS